MIKRHEMDDSTSCLSKARDDEPIFILRAQDILAPIVVKYWATLASDAGVSGNKCRGAWDLANAMKQWPDRKLPD